MHRILFVDDDPSVLSSLRRGFRKSAKIWDMHFAQSSEDALSQLNADAFDLVVSDVKMPGKSGFALLAEIRVRYPETAVILMTGMPSIDAAIEAIKLGAVNYLSKPIDHGEMRLAIAKALEDSEMTHTRTGDGGIRSQIGDYEVVKQIDEGSMGIVFLVEKEEADERKQYALKLLKTGVLPQTEREEAVERFRREAEIAMHMSHPNIIYLHEYGLVEKDRIPYMVMEYFDGDTLDVLIYDKDSNLDYLAKAMLLRQIASALAEVHKSITCHRDIKPANIMVNAEGLVKLIDFGIAKLPKSQLTQPDCIMGTPAYIAPETISNNSKIDRASDLFSLGVVAYELFLKRRPFDAENLVALARQIWQADPLEPKSLDPHIPEPICAMIEKLLAKKPEDRYPTADELIDDLQAFINSALCGTSETQA